MEGTLVSLVLDLGSDRVRRWETVDVTDAVTVVTGAERLTGE